MVPQHTTTKYSSARTTHHTHTHSSNSTPHTTVQRTTPHELLKAGAMLVLFATVDVEGAVHSHGSDHKWYCVLCALRGAVADGVVCGAVCWGCGAVI